MKRISKKLWGSLLLILALLLCLTACGEKEEERFIFSIVVPEGTLYIDTSYDLSYKLGDGETLYDPVFSLSNNTANATINGNTILAEKPGSVHVQLSGKSYGLDYTTGVTLTFLDRTVALDIEDKQYRIGDVIELKYKFLPNRGDYAIRNEYITYEVVSGDAVVKTENDRDYLIGRQEGTVTLKLSYEDDKGNKFEATDEVTFIRHGFELSVDKNSLFVGYELPLTATAKDINKFDATKVIYVLESGNATLTGNVLCAIEEGNVKVYATYDYNGAILKSNVLDMTFGFDENVILTAEDLTKMNGSDAVFNLLKDVDLASVGNWTPIRGFTGTLRGNGHKITGMKMTVGNLAENCGLFDVITGKVSDLTVSGTVVSTGQATNIGILCGKNEGTLERVKAEGSITATYCSYVGGVTGLCVGSGIVECESSVSIQAKDFVGGIAGQLNATRSSTVIIDKNVNRGEIKGASSVGGVFGAMTVAEDRNNDAITVGNLENYGKVTGSANGVGGIFGVLKGNYYYYSYTGYTAYISALACTNEGDVSGADNVGGIVGDASDKVSEISMCISTGSVKGNMYVGGYVGNGRMVTMNGMKNTSVVTGKAYVGGVAGYAGSMNDCENNGTINVTNFYIDENNVALSYVGGVAGYSASMTNCKNTVNIDVSTGGAYVGGVVGYLAADRNTQMVVSGNSNSGSVKGTTYVGGFAGMLTVQGYQNNDAITVSDNTNKGEVSGTRNYVGGLFGKIAGNYYRYNYNDYNSYVYLTGCTNEGEVNGADYVGGIAGEANTLVSEISLCTCTGAVTGNMYVGGYVGDAGTAIVRNLINRNSITGKAYVGGIAGKAGVLTGCENNGPLTIVGHHIDEQNVALSYVGGIAGYATGAVDCVNHSAVNVSNGGRYVGGIVGYLNALRDATKTISGNKNYGKVTGTSYVGGISGCMIVVSYQNNDSIQVRDNRNEADIIGSGDNVGGIIGWAEGNYYRYNWEDYYSNVKFTGCVNEGDINGNNCVGGIVGNGSTYVSEISLCTAGGDVTGNMYVGAFAGDASSAELISLRNNNTVAGKAYVGGIAGKAGKLNGCENNGSLTIDSYHLDEQNTPLSYVGGIAGYATGAVNCINNMAIDVSRGGYYVGGIAGYLALPSEQNVSVSGNRNIAEIQGTSYVGGIAGALKGVSGNLIFLVDNNTNEETVEASGNYVGGIIGDVQGNGSTVKVTNSKSEADVTGADYVGGVIGCGTNTESASTVWGTNRFSGTVSATGSYKGDHYGKLN